MNTEKINAKTICEEIINRKTSIKRDLMREICMIFFFVVMGPCFVWYGINRTTLPTLQARAMYILLCVFAVLGILICLNSVKIQIKLIKQLSTLLQNVKNGNYELEEYSVVNTYVKDGNLYAELDNQKSVCVSNENIFNSLNNDSVCCLLKNDYDFEFSFF